MQLGKVQEWNDEKGYGFAVALDDAISQRFFFHINDYAQNGRRPETGELIRFKPGKGTDGRPRALSVQRAVQSRPTVAAKQKVESRPWEISIAAASLLICVFAAVIGWAIHADRLPFMVGVVLFALSCVTFIAYSLDKDAAQRGHWRIQEGTLHTFELLGGWPGALIAQKLLRHKTRKASYQFAFWLAVIVNCAALGWWIVKH